jgi:transcription antitermination factor NusG
MDWFAFRTAPRKESQIWELLKDDDALRHKLSVDDVYHPIETYSIRLRMKRHPVVRARPLTPGYIFIRCANPHELKAALGSRGITGVAGNKNSAGAVEPVRISAYALLQVKIAEAEIATKQRRRTDRSKKKIRNGSQVKVGDRLMISHLGVNVANQPVSAIEGNYAETVAPNGIKIKVPLADCRTA